MCRSSSLHDSGSAVIEVVAIGGFVFLVAMAAVSATVNQSLAIDNGTEASRTVAIHSARHDDVETASAAVRRWPGIATVTGSAESIRVAVHLRVGLPHPSGARTSLVSSISEVPLAPYRSARG